MDRKLNFLAKHKSSAEHGRGKASVAADYLSLVQVNDYVKGDEGKLAMGAITRALNDLELQLRISPTIYKTSV